MKNRGYSVRCEEQDTSFDLRNGQGKAEGLENREEKEKRIWNSEDGRRRKRRMEGRKKEKAFLVIFRSADFSIGRRNF